MIQSIMTLKYNNEYFEVGELGRLQKGGKHCTGKIIDISVEEITIDISKEFEALTPILLLAEIDSVERV